MGLLGFTTHNQGRQDPEDNGKRQCYNVTHSPGKIEQQEYVAQEAKGQGNDVEYDLPRENCISTCSQDLAIVDSTYHLGSVIPTPLSSMPAGSCPLSGSVRRQGEAKAAMDKTLERGPMVAATRGIAVEANHHRLEARKSVSMPGNNTRQHGSAEVEQELERDLELQRERQEVWTDCGRLSVRPRSLISPPARLLTVSERSIPNSESSVVVGYRDTLAPKNPEPVRLGFHSCSMAPLSPEGMHAPLVRAESTG